MPRTVSGLLIVSGVLALLGGCSSMSTVSNGPIFGRTYSHKTRFKVARAQEQRGKLHEARELYQKLYAEGKQDASVCHRLAIVSARMNDHAAAEKYFQEALRKDQRNADLLADYGYSLALGNNLKGAESMYRRAIQISPGHKRSLNNLGIALAHQRRDDEALQTFRSIVGEAKAYSNLAFVQAQRGDGGLAAKNYSHALSIDPSLKQASNAMVQLANIEKKFLQTNRGRQLLAQAKHRAETRKPAAAAQPRPLPQRQPQIVIKPKSKQESLIAAIEDKPTKTVAVPKAPATIPQPTAVVKRAPSPMVEPVPDLPVRTIPQVAETDVPAKSIADATNSTGDNARQPVAAIDEPSRHPIENDAAAPFPAKIEPKPAPAVTRTPELTPTPSVADTNDKRFLPPVVTPKAKEPEFVMDLSEGANNTAKPTDAAPKFVAPVGGVRSSTNAGVSHAESRWKRPVERRTAPPKQSTGRIRLSSPSNAPGVIRLRN